MQEIILLTFVLTGFAGVVFAKNQLESDVLWTSAGELTMSFIGHGTLMFRFGDMVIHVDPWGKLADYSKLPKADLILITHEHRDHLDPVTIADLRKPKTVILHPESGADKVTGGTVVTNGQSITVAGIHVEVVAAYNIKHKRGLDSPYHPPGVGNGYVLTFGDKRVYVAGDTENTPEMKSLKNIDVAFLPMNLPYTMTPEMVADAAKAFQPRILYPYHYGNSDPLKLVLLLKGNDIEVRTRSLK